jgi:O-antigen ligase
MESKAASRLLGTYVIVTSIAVSLFVSPWNSIDPVNLPKLVLLGFLSPIALALSLSKIKFLTDKKSRAFALVLLLFVIQLTLALLLSPGDFAFHFYGTPSRNTGYLAYLSLSFLLISSATSANSQVLKKYAYAILGIGSILALYGIAQSRGLDFFNYENAYGSDVFGTFGNPNFQSAFMGITAAVAMSWAFFSALKIQTKFFLFTISGLAIVNIAFSSQQGYLNFMAGLLGCTIVYLFSKKKIILGWITLGMSTLAIVTVGAGILNSGPLASVLYKSSLQAREFYWRAAIKMIVEHPFFGVGLDGFGEWYRRARTQEVAKFNPGITADTAHNIPLDIGSSGGLPLLILYLLLIGLAGLSIVKVVKRTKDFDVVFGSIVAGWVAYQAQSLISINQLGLGVWGWSLTGLLIGYEINTRNLDQDLSEKSSRTVKLKNEKIPASTLLVACVAGAIGLAVSLPPYIAANKYYKALQSGDGELLQKSAYLKPNDRTRYLYAAQILASNKYEDRAIEVLIDASKIYPDSFELWQQLSQIPSATPEQKAKAMAEMKRLDPFNPELK